mmetsp:Transcript_32829/g.78155  ORF Transcript_32829/g.78155 Transcript_32829/m.78155 type:complete len:504 (+) Transcript_32829:806-2317(+)
MSGSTVLTHNGPIAFLMPMVSFPVLSTHSSIASGMPTGEVPALRSDRRNVVESSIAGVVVVVVVVERRREERQQRRRVPARLRQERPHHQRGERRQERGVPRLHELLDAADDGGGARVRGGGGPERHHHLREQGVPELAEGGDQRPGRDASRDARLAQVLRPRHRRHREPARSWVRLHDRPADGGVRVQDERGELPRPAPAGRVSRRVERPGGDGESGRVQPAAPQGVPEAVHQRQLSQDVQLGGGERRGAPVRLVGHGRGDAREREGVHAGRGPALAALAPGHHIAHLVRLLVRPAREVAQRHHRRRHVQTEQDARGVPQERGDHGRGDPRPAPAAEARRAVRDRTTAGAHRGVRLARGHGRGDNQAPPRRAQIRRGGGQSLRTKLSPGHDALHGRRGREPRVHGRGAVGGRERHHGRGAPDSGCDHDHVPALRLEEPRREGQDRGRARRAGRPRADVRGRQRRPTRVHAERHQGDAAAAPADSHVSAARGGGRRHADGARG